METHGGARGWTQKRTSGERAGLHRGMGERRGGTHGERTEGHMAACPDGN